MDARRSEEARLKRSYQRFRESERKNARNLRIEAGLHVEEEAEVQNAPPEEMFPRLFAWERFQYQKPNQEQADDNVAPAEQEDAGDASTEEARLGRKKEHVAEAVDPLDMFALPAEECRLSPKDQNPNNREGASLKKQSAGELRLNKDLADLNLPNKSCSISFPNEKTDMMNFDVSIKPEDGYYHNETFLFSFKISAGYPHEAPNVKCKTKVDHPNIDVEGNVCLNILGDGWKPVMDINRVIQGLLHLLREPNSEDALNHEATSILRDNTKDCSKQMSGGP